APRRRRERCREAYSRSRSGRPERSRRRGRFAVFPCRGCTLGGAVAPRLRDAKGQHETLPGSFVPALAFEVIDPALRVDPHERIEAIAAFLTFARAQPVPPLF